MSTSPFLTTVCDASCLPPIPQYVYRYSAGDIDVYGGDR